MKFSYIEKTYKVVIAGAIALGVVASISTYAAGPAEHTVSPSPTPTVQPR